MAAYLRFLIQADMRGLVSPQDKTIVYQLPEGTEIKYKELTLTSKNKEEFPAMWGYGNDHANVMDELKDMLEERKKKYAE